MNEINLHSSAADPSPAPSPSCREGSNHHGLASLLHFSPVIAEAAGLIGAGEIGELQLVRVRAHFGAASAVLSVDPFWPAVERLAGPAVELFAWQGEASLMVSARHARAGVYSAIESVRSDGLAPRLPAGLVELLFEATGTDGLVWVRPFGPGLVAAPWLALKRKDRLTVWDVQPGWANAPDEAAGLSPPEQDSARRLAEAVTKTLREGRPAQLGPATR